MPRLAKIWYRKDRKAWMGRVNGRRVSLGPDEREAQRKFEALRSSDGALNAHTTTVAKLFAMYLEWASRNRARGTVSNQRHYLSSLLDTVGKALKINQLKPSVVREWGEKFPTPSAQSDAIAIAQRAFNWAVEMEKIDASPIPKIRKPSRRRRDVVYNEDQWAQIKANATGAVIPLLDFLWSTGCRPHEARTVTAEYVHEEKNLVIFPTQESKGKKFSRVIYLTDHAFRILKDNWNDEGPIFRNQAGNPWTKDALCGRCKRISDKVGFRVIAYGPRHSFVTRALTREVDVVSLSILMGHKDTRMVNNYAHLAGNTAFLTKQATKVTGES